MPIFFNNNNFSYTYYQTLKLLLDSESTYPYKYLTRNSKVDENDEIIVLDTLRMSMDRVKEYVEKLNSNVVIDDNTFLHNNVHQSNGAMYNFPTGATCKQALRNNIIGVNLDFLVAEDNGTRALLPSMYYALGKSGLLLKEEPYVLNYVSTSQKKNSRCRYSFNILRFHYYIDYIITPGFMGDNTELYNHCDKYSNVGFVIYSKPEPILSDNASVIVSVENTGFAFYFFYKKKRVKKHFSIKKKKTVPDELMPFLRQNIT